MTPRFSIVCLWIVGGNRRRQADTGRTTLTICHFTKLKSEISVSEKNNNCDFTFGQTGPNPRYSECPRKHCGTNKLLKTISGSQIGGRTLSGLRVVIRTATTALKLTYLLILEGSVTRTSPRPSEADPGATLDMIDGDIQSERCRSWGVCET